MPLSPADPPSRSSLPRPAAGWSESTRPGELGSGFGGSVLGPPAEASVPLPGEGSAFDVCHVGMVLRGVVLVQAVLALGTMYTAASPLAWMLAYARGSVGALLAVLCWLVVACLLKRWLALLTVSTQWVFAVALGAASAGLGWLLLLASGLGDEAAHHGLAPMASGAALAGAFFYWLRLRAKARLPAETTARLAELQSRIRPHFLFNTLNSAVTLVRIDPARAEAVLEDLAELFRVALTQGDDVASLADEVELARRYLAIEQLRFGERLQVTWDIDPSTHDARLPALLLQPLVENAVRHGIEPALNGGSIRVRSRLKRGHAVVDIVNTLGNAPSQPGHGMALQNVRERLRLMHDVAAQFDARRESDVFRVQIVVPMEDR